MKQKVRITLLGVYDIILSLGAIFTGVMMISSSNGIFIEYPKDWLTKIPFESWVIPGIITIILFGLGNIISAMLCFKKESNKPWIMSAIMGGLFFISIFVQVIILREWYLATVEFLIFSAIQLSLSGYAFSGARKNQMSPQA